MQSDKIGDAVAKTNKNFKELDRRLRRVERELKIKKSERKNK